MFMYKTREAAPEYATFRQTQLALLKSQQVIDTALSQDEVRSLHAVRTKADPTEWLQEQLTIGFSIGSEVLEIAMSGDDPKTVATLVNAVTAAYLQEVVNVDHEDRLKRLEGLKEIWKKFETNLRQKQEQLRMIAQAVGSDDKKALTLQKQYEIERQDLLRRNLIEVHAELLKRKAELQFADDRDRRSQENAQARVPVAVIEEELQKDPIITEHEERIGLLKQEVMKNSRAVRKPGTDPSLEATWSKIRTEELALKQRRKKLRALLEAQLRDGPVRGETGSLRSLGDQVAMLEQLESQYKGELQSVKEETREFNNKSFDFGLLQAEVELDEKAAREVGDEIRHVELELNQAPPRIKTFEKAKVPHAKDQDKKLKMAGLVGGGVFLLIVLAMTFLEYRTHRVGFIDDVVLTTGMPVVGTLPILTRWGAGRLANGQGSSLQRRNDLLVESIDTTRLMLIRATQPESLRVLMITSATSGEGKTSLASHLAVSLSRSGRRTLLVDSDVRRPSLHHLLESPLAPGLCEYLRGEVGLAEIVRPTALANLAFVSAGSMDEPALTALARHDLHSMFTTLKTGFDFVVVDTSPILSVADPLLFGQHVDAVVFAVMNNVSRIPDVLTAYNRLIALGIRVLGAVVAGTREGSDSASPYAYRYQARNPDTPF